VLAYHPMWKN